MRGDDHQRVLVAGDEAAAFQIIDGARYRFTCGLDDQREFGHRRDGADGAAVAFTGLTQQLGIDAAGGRQGRPLDHPA